MNNLIYKEEAYKIVGACFEVHKELGSGFLEKVYHEALAIILAENHIPYEHEKELAIHFKGKLLNQKYYADFVCYDKIIIEIKTVSELNDIHRAQVLNYLKATGYKLGLLINFSKTSLQYERLVRT